MPCPKQVLVEVALADLDHGTDTSASVKPGRIFSTPAIRPSYTAV